MRKAYKVLIVADKRIEESIGALGLVACDELGNKVYGNHAADIADCYALNVVKEKEIWFYYYTDFLLGCISGGPVQAKVTFIDPCLFALYVIQETMFIVLCGKERNVW
ncbi:hypothetical protein [Paenibacillus harenae]|uniref:hypothetical protein n=1 Tax=Paenibacillus harenae TaxID=306543 RepID=UPI0004136816|nr:hypothetical protein [Paenibacillus harenae]